MNKFWIEKKKNCKALSKIPKTSSRSVSSLQFPVPHKPCHLPTFRALHAQRLRSTHRSLRAWFLWDAEQVAATSSVAVMSQARCHLKHHVAETTTGETRSTEVEIATKATWLSMSLVGHLIMPLANFIPRRCLPTASFPDLPWSRRAPPAPSKH
jgi:hypothetical protein